MQVFKCISDIIKGVNVENPRFLVKQMQVIKGNVLKTVLSDGVDEISGLFASSLTAPLREAELGTEQIITVTKYRVQIMNNQKPVLFVQEVKPEIIACTVTGEYGNNAMLEQTKLESDVKKEPMTNSPAPAINKQQAQVVSARGSLTVPSERVDLSQQPVQPISTVNPYQGKLTIKAKVIHKSDMREWKNARSSGKLFSVDLADNSGEIHATAFNADADMLFSVLQEGHVYYISNAKVKPASRYNTMKNDHELTLYDQTIVQEADIKAQDIAIKYNFVPLAEIAALADKSVCDVVGILLDCGEVSEFTSKAGKELKKRTVKLGDTNQASIGYLLWGENATSFSYEIGDIIAIHGARVSEYNNVKSLSGGLLEKNPNIQESAELLEWYKDHSDANFTPVGGMDASAGNASRRKQEIETIAFSKGQTQELTINTPYYATHIAYISVLPSAEKQLYYPSCPKCKKKMEEMDGEYTCTHCGETGQCVYKYILSAQIIDSTSTQWVSLFGELGDVVLGVPASQIHQLKAEGSETVITDLFKSVLFRDRFVVSCRTKLEQYNGEERKKVSVVNIKKANIVEESSRLIKIISQYGL